MNYIQFNKQEFQDNIQNLEIIDAPGFEYTYQIPTISDNVSLRIYSSVDKSTDICRPSGKDRVRLVFINITNNLPISKGVGINRVGDSKENFFNRLRGRINELIKTKSDGVNWLYIKSILSNGSSSFSNSLLESLTKYKKLTKGQLSYIVSDTGKSPKGYPTLEMQVLKKNPNFFKEEIEFKEETLEDKVEIENKIETPVDIKCDHIINHTHTDNLISTKDYPYPFKEFNPVQSKVIEFKGSANNLIICSSTGSGKTIAAEIMIDESLKTGKVIYTSPLKALSQEKLSEWKLRYPNKKISILTGDYKLTKKQQKELNNSDILILTTEMLDSRLSSINENNQWLNKASLLVTDEAHLINSKGRGSVTEVGLMAFSKLNPEAKIVLLSATLPGTDILGEWLYVLNGRKTDVVTSDWRPVELKVSFPNYEVSCYPSGGMNYKNTESNKIYTALEIIESCTNEKIIVFVHSKITGRRILGELANTGHVCDFHSADLKLQERLDIEESFKSSSPGSIDVLISTSTLAQGLNMPCSSAVIVGWHRGMNNVSTFEIIQEAGRSGRIGYCDGIGKAFILTPSGETMSYKNLYNNPGNITSQLSESKHTLGFQILSEIKKGTRNLQGIKDWYSRSFGYLLQNDFSNDQVEEFIESLLGMQMITNKKGYRVTRLGRISLNMYLSPYDTYALFENGWKIFDDDKFSDEGISYLFGNIPSNYLPYVPKDIKDNVDYLIRELRYKIDIPHTVAATFQALKNDKSASSGLKAMARNVQFDIDRLISTVVQIDQRVSKWGKEELWSILPLRFKYSIPEEIIELVTIPGVGGAYAKKLYKAGFSNIKDLKQAKSDELYRVLKPGVAKKVIKFLKSN